MRDMVELVVVGGGKMGEALLGGLVAAGWAEPEAIAVAEPDAARRAVLAAALPGVVVDDRPVPAAAGLIAVKPQHVVEACVALAEHGVGRVLSIAAGVTTATIEAALPAGTAVVRAMPNTPALVGRGASAIAAGSAAGEEDLRWAEQVLGAVGTVVRVAEGQLDAVTGLSGSGPAYLFLVAEAMIDAGVEQGLSRAVAAELVAQTVLGAGTLLAGGEAPADLRAAVTSPGGTTAAGLRALEDGAVRSAVAAAVEAATRRSRDLG